jgi:MFS family permease
VLAVSVLGSGIAALDATVVNIALPAIGRDFGTGVAALQWVMNGYTLTLAAFLLIGGSLGDRFGRRKVYLIGTAWFALASAACGFAPDVLSARHVPESRSPDAVGRTDYLGAAACCRWSSRSYRATRRSAPGWRCCR